MLQRASNIGAQMSKNILLLQGPPSFFARDLAEHLQNRGLSVLRVNFCIGDWFYGRKGASLNYRGSLKNWPDALRKIITEHKITDILYFADRLPYHVAAQRVAKEFGINAISYEFGYLRPDWLIVEKGGQSSYSYFPSDLAEIQKRAKGLPAPNTKLLYPFPFARQATNEVFYNLSNYFLWFTYPKYQADKYYNPLIEYLCYIPRLIKGSLGASTAETLVETLVEGDDPFFVIPLQMQNDYQIRKNSPYDGLHEFIEEILISFKAHGQENARLVFKVHPLDNGMENWPKVLKKLGAKYNLSDRIDYLDGGNLFALLKAAKGSVIINSTTGVSALQLGCPVITLGIAVYDIKGITYQGNLDAFWKRPGKVNRTNVSALLRLFAHSIHVKGNFFTKEGRHAAATAFADRLIENRINDGGYPMVQDRIAKARKMGIEIDD